MLSWQTLLGLIDLYLDDILWIKMIWDLLHLKSSHFELPGPVNLDFL